MAAQDVVEKYSTYCSWLRDSKFLQELENDSVDSEILEEELKALRVIQVPLTTRQKLVKLLQSNPVQFVLCVIILLDAGIVIAQILLDINSVKEMLHHQDLQLEVLVRYIKQTSSDLSPEDNGNYDIDDVIRILDERHKLTCAINVDVTDASNVTSFPAAEVTKTAQMSFRIGEGEEQRQEEGQRERRRNGEGEGGMREGEFDLRTGDGPSDLGNEFPGEIGVGDIGLRPFKRLNPEPDEFGHQTGTGSDSDSLSPIQDTLIFLRTEQTDSAPFYRHSLASDRGPPLPEVPPNDLTPSSVDDLGNPDQGHSRKRICDADRMQIVHRDHHDVYHQLAHGLHLTSIAILGLLVIEDIIKIIAMGKSFCQHKMEVYDAIIIAASFTMDLVFLGGVAGEEGQKAAGILVILLIWRIARVIDGIVMTVKQRQEFRIALQKRARRMAEKKLEQYEEDRIAKDREIEALKELCLKAGLRDEDLIACAPKQSRRVSRTMCALSSVAQLSISVTMSVPSQIDTDPDTSSSGPDKDDPQEVSIIKPLHRFSLPTNDPQEPIKIRTPAAVVPAGVGSSEARRNTVPGSGVIIGGSGERMTQRPLTLIEDSGQRSDRGVGDGESRARINSPINCSGVEIVIEDIDDEEEVTSGRDDDVERYDDVGNDVSVTSKRANQTVIRVNDDDDDDDAQRRKCV